MREIECREMKRNSIRLTGGKKERKEKTTKTNHVDGRLSRDGGRVEFFL